MPSPAPSCPSLARLFRCGAGQEDSAVTEVASAIYQGGKADGLHGMECVACIIQNRCGQEAFPNEPQSVVRNGGDQFQWNAEVPRRQPDRRLFDEARQLARQLVNPPFELSLADPTGGALYFDPRGPCNRHSVLPLTGSPPQPSAHSAPLEGSSEADPVPDDDGRGIEPPRHGVPETGVCGFHHHADNARQIQGAPGSAPAGRGANPPSSGAQSRSADASSSGSAPAPPSGAGSRALATPSLEMPPSSRLFSGRRRSHGMLGFARGPADESGYHDMVLPCGLFQEEVIELMYRDLQPEDYDLLNKLDERVSKKNIMGRNSVDKLPRQLAQECDCTQCGICLAEVPPSAHVVQLPCRHAFHPACISRWLTQCKSTCPLCFSPIERPAAGTAAQDPSETNPVAACGEGLQVCSV